MKEFLGGNVWIKKPKSQITLPGEAADLLLQYDEACEKLEVITERKRHAENLLKEMMGDYEVGTIGDRTVIWKSVSQERLDSKTLKAEHPALYKKYVSKTSYWGDVRGYGSPGHEGFHSSEP